MGEKGVDDPTMTAAAGSLPGAPGEVHSVAPPPSGKPSIADQKRYDFGFGSGGPSGTITHPGGATLEHDEDGEWIYTTPDGTVAQWHPEADTWRHRESGDAIELPPPEELAHQLSLGTD